MSSEGEIYLATREVALKGLIEDEARFYESNPPIVDQVKIGDVVCTYGDRLEAYDVISVEGEVVCIERRGDRFPTDLDSLKLGEIQSPRGPLRIIDFCPREQLERFRARESAYLIV